MSDEGLRVGSLFSGIQSAASTMGSRGLGFDTSSSLSRILGGEKSSLPVGPGCPSTTTYELWVSNQRRELRQMDVAPSLTEPGGFTQAPFLVGYEMSDGSPVASPLTRSYAKQADSSDRHAGPPNLLISSAAVSPAKTSASPETAPDSPATDPASSTSSPASLSLFDPDGYSSRTYPVSSLATAVGTSEQSLERWPTSGTAWAGGFSTAATSECRSADAGCSSSEPSLSEILEPPLSVPARYSLSARAATGILRRAEKRGRVLPAHLLAALQAVSTTPAPEEDS